MKLPVERRLAADVFATADHAFSAEQFCARI
jgi:hypothetical protein